MDTRVKEDSADLQKSRLGDCWYLLDITTEIKARRINWMGDTDHSNNKGDDV